MLAQLMVISCLPSDQIRISMPSIADIPDGKYTGTYFSFPVRAKVEVDIAAGRITAVRILSHFSSEHGKPAEQLAGTIVEKQTLLVDVVAGASHSSRVILKAGENALEKVKR